jgi:S1-C subfamily serine protease
MIGVGLEPLPGDAANAGQVQGVLVASVAAGGPADQAGLRIGDVITAAAGQPIQNASQLVAAVERTGVGRPLVLTVNRGGSVLQLQVVPLDLGRVGRQG